MRVFAVLPAALVFTVATAFAAVDLSFEATDTNLLQYPSFSGSNRGITSGTAAVTTRPYFGDNNNTLNPIDGAPGTACYKTTFMWTSVSNIQEQAFLRITDANDRHTLSDPAPTSGIGIYVKYSGGAGPLRIALTIREDPTATGDNEIYEQTKWATLQGSDNWQYLYWDFATGMNADFADSWPVRNVLGDGIYDGAVGEATKFEAVLLTPIEGRTHANEPINILFDDIHTGPRHTPIAPPDLSDSDHDGIRDANEANYGTDINNRDSDGDGFEDGVEVAIGSNPADPASPANQEDSDGDGLPDSVDPNSATPDADGDGFQDFAEVALGSDPSSGNVRPNLGDVDNNGVIDLADSTLLMNVYLGWIPAGTGARERMDINRDGIVDSVDVVILLNWYLRNMPYLPY